MSYGKLITRFTTGGHDIFITCPAKSMHLESFGLSGHAFCGTGDENIIPTCRSAGNYYIVVESKMRLTFSPEKTCLRGSRPGKTQTGLLSYRDKLAAISSMGIILAKQRATKTLIKLHGCAG